MMNPYPLKCRPIFKERIWGGRKLAEAFGKELPAGKTIGESWELADLSEGRSIIANGELAGMAIGEAVRRYPAEMMGTKGFAGEFPLLVKILDAEDVLSVQVHPDEETCRRMGRGQAKTECWYVMRAARGAVIYKGLKAGVTREALATAVGSGTAADMLVRIEVKPGECYMLPAGTPHALGAGIIVAEVQTPSDTTYRLFDWGRTGDGGKPRELHIAEAMESIHFGVSPNEMPATTVGRLVASKYFNVDKGHQAAGMEVLLAGMMKAIMIIEGEGRVVSSKAAAVEFARGETILVPAGFEGAAVFGADTEYLTITL
jgi:mannose-6-phosphate isomerase